MQLDDAVLDFVSGPVLLMACAADPQRRPAIGRAMGVASAGDGIDVMVSEWQWPQVVANIRSSGRLALTAARARDYVTYQLKGTAALRAARPDDLERAQRYWADLAATLAQDHVPAYVMGRWSPDREMVVAHLGVAEVYVQTPGPLAGTLL